MWHRFQNPQKVDYENRKPEPTSQRTLKIYSKQQENNQDKVSDNVVNLP